ncbi:MAG: radical SAM protein [Corynebacterium sp.]|nr:radical SAM protein [Corynebacterium sp.]
MRPPVEVLHKFSKPVECLGIAYCAAALREAGFSASMVDGMLHDWTNEETANRILELNPDVIGITVVLNYFPEITADLCRLLRNKGFYGKVIVGGHAVSFVPERVFDIAPEVDAVIIGEGEETIVNFVKELANGDNEKQVLGVSYAGGQKASWFPAARQRDLDALPLPARDLTPEVINLDGLVCISTSRGCYARCTFCSIPRFYGLEKGKTLANGNWLARSAASTVREIQWLHETFGVVELLVVDDEFFGGNKLAAISSPVEFAISCRAENVDPQTLISLMEGGLRHVFVGLETGSDDSLKLYGKGHSVFQNKNAVRIIKSLGLSFQPGFMLFNHKSTLSEIRENLEFLSEIDELKPVTINTSVEPHFGTPINRVIEHDQLLIDERYKYTSNFRDYKVAYAKKISQLIADKFSPTQGLIAGLQSAITFEWRRSIPGRSRNIQIAIDKFEKKCNALFAQIFVDAIDLLDSTPLEEAPFIVEEVNSRLNDAKSKVAVLQAILLDSICNEEGSVRYYKQTDIISMKGLK